LNLEYDLSKVLHRYPSRHSKIFKLSKLLNTAINPVEGIHDVW
jgi:hypothetical protein